MLTLTKLYTFPDIINPIDFTTGLNIILGEKDESSEKRNGVGKSLCIEFINFALLKRKSSSRVSLIPKEIFPRDTLICLDFQLHDKSYTIKRSLENSERPIVIENGQEFTFSKLEDTVDFMTERLFSGLDESYPSFRVMLGPLIRDERSEFKSIVNCHDTKSRAIDDYSPHLYLFGISLDVYDHVRHLIKSIDDINKDLARIKENVHLIRQKSIEDARSDLNELDSEVQAIEDNIEKLENIAGYEIVKDEIIELEGQIDQRRRRKGILKQQLSKLEPVSDKVDIDPTELGEFYDSLKQGLGNLLKRSLEETIEFKKRIDEFQNKLLTDKRASISVEIDKLDKELRALDKLYTQNLQVLNQTGELTNLKQTYVAYKEKSDELSQLRSFLDRFDDLEIQRQQSKTNKETELLRLQSSILLQKSVIEDFQKTILYVHDFIQGNKQASFQLKHTTDKAVIQIVMRIDADGSHSVERAKIFIYDISLLINEHTVARHPGFLIHDNIFDVDQDTLQRSISFLQHIDFGRRQYILTINSDRIDENVGDLEGYVRARFTKTERFLKTKYQELQSNSE